MNTNNSLSQKQKIINNLDKICIEQTGHLANAELLKNDEGNEYFFRKGVYGSDSSDWKKWWAKIQKVEIDGEEIDLSQVSKGKDDDDYWKIRQELINEIKQNPQDWKIDEEKHTGGIGETVRHRKTGRRHWKVLGLLKEWDEIEALLGNKDLPNNPKLPEEKKPDKQKDNSEKLEKEFQEIKKQLTEVQEQLIKALARVEKLEGKKRQGNN